MSPPTLPDGEPPVCLILGGTTTVGRALANYLLRGDNPKATVLSAARDDLAMSPGWNCQYIQINLGNTARHDEIFTPPTEWQGVKRDWKRFDYVFDFSGETGFDKAELLQISNTYQTALSLATSAANLPDEQKPLAWVRLHQPFYEMKSSSSSHGHTEADKLKPDGNRGRWWHEALRGIAAIPGLNTGIIRCAAWYGPGTWDFEVVPRLVAGHVYKYLSCTSELSGRYQANDSGDLRINTVHAQDISQAMHLMGLWLAQNPREVVLKEAGVELEFPFSPQPEGKSTFNSIFHGKDKKNKRPSSLTDTWKTIPTVLPEGERPRIPLFNVTDDSDSTQESLGKLIAQLWDIKIGFLNSTVVSLVEKFSKVDFNEMIEDVNEKHVEAWSQMLLNCDPPIHSTPLSPYLDPHSFRRVRLSARGSFLE
ncbi:hypothetical protein A1Q2_05575 [Trichosporon asahii var. asahii CBS 8904]|uniref:NAD-dependent epimerase/dehydratase domain-containing protein n=1 Tax=Trichosporon asahii var. asahii (strain CBS 8904) TaxID=1220162 RepID=K1VLF5_TRIAC|nr:hypothetical protein A1Q2_05575 [Trichosporon asahii var. asahii CBS 8904]